MLECSSDFTEMIKSSYRETKAKVILNYSEPICLFDDSISSIDIDSNADICLGCVQNDAHTLKILKGSIRDEQFNQVIDVDVYIGVVLGDDTEYIKIGTYAADGWGKDDKTGIITIELTSKINTISNIPKNLISLSGESLSEYMKRFIAMIYGEELSINDAVLSQVISKSWLYSEDTLTQLNFFCEALNGILRYTNKFELIPFKTSEAVDTLKVGDNEAIIEISRISDYSGVFPNVQILRSKFVESAMEKLSSPSPVLDEEHSTLNLNLSCPCYVSGVIFKNEYGRLASIEQGITHCVVDVYNAYDEAAKIPFEVYGRKIESVLIDKKQDNNAITYIENPYIHSSEHVGKIDKSIYAGIRFKVKYRGNPCYQIGDTINVSEIGDILITKHTLSYRGYLTGTIEGVYNA